LKNRWSVRSAPPAKIGRASLDRPLPPLSYRVSRTLEQRIRDHHCKAGDRLPSEDDLCRELGASRITIRQAVGRLVEQGLIVRRRGSGSFVSALLGLGEQETVARQALGMLGQAVDRPTLVGADIGE
jgi:DNA-binding GntR family transcriptional regulator